MGKMIVVEGFKAFRGVMIIKFAYDELADDVLEDVVVRGEWLYRPDTDCWYCNGVSYPAGICSVLKVE